YERQRAEGQEHCQEESDQHPPHLRDLGSRRTRTRGAGGGARTCDEDRWRWRGSRSPQSPDHRRRRPVHRSATAPATPASATPARTRDHQGRSVAMSRKNVVTITTMRKVMLGTTLAWRGLSSVMDET